MIDAPAAHAATITPDDDNDLSENTRGIYVGGTGDLVVITVGGETITFSDVPAGSLVPIRASRVLESTTATNLVGMW